MAWGAGLQHHGRAERRLNVAAGSIFIGLSADWLSSATSGASSDGLRSWDLASAGSPTSVSSVSVVWQERSGSSVLVRTVWRAEVELPGQYPVVGSKYWRLSFIRRANGELAAEVLHSEALAQDQGFCF